MKEHIHENRVPASESTRMAAVERFATVTVALKPPLREPRCTITCSHRRHPPDQWQVVGSIWAVRINSRCWIRMCNPHQQQALGSAWAALYHEEQVLSSRGSICVSRPYQRPMSAASAGLHWLSVAAADAGPYGQHPRQQQVLGLV